MWKISGIILLTIGAFFFCCAPLCEAYHVAVLKSSDIKPYDDAIEGFRSSCDDCRLREINHDGDDPEVLKKVLDAKPDMVLAIGLDAFRHAQAVKDLPVVYTMAPPSQSLITAPRNISGVSISVPPARQLDTILDLLPNARRIGLIYNPRNAEAYVEEALRISQSRGIELVLRKAQKPGDVPALIEGMMKKIDVFWMLPDATVVNPETVNLLLLASFQNRVPIFTFSKKYVEMGALASLSVDPYDLGAQAGEIAARIIRKGNDQSPIRVGARKAVLSINNKVARKLGIKIRDEIMNRAENVN